MVTGQSEDHFSESERMIQLARYHREALLASQEEAFITTATMIGLMERQQEEIKFRYSNCVIVFCTTLCAMKILPLCQTTKHFSDITHVTGLVSGKS